MSPISLDELIARYLAAVEAGEQPERERLIADHPQFAEPLREFFADLDQMDRVIHPNTEGNVDRVPLTENLRRLLSTQNQEQLGRLRGGRQQQPSERIGNYKLLQRIGTGGMGEVWMAEQERPVRRRVALKLIKAGMDSRQVVARFEAERQALAMMDHQNIAKVLDAGTTDDGRPYFVMELVQGIPITLYCDQNKLSIDDRLNLFIPVCKAVQHAHQKGIIHRDLKPSNILVTLYDGRAVPKVIDFGLAKALQHQSKLTDKTLFTEFGQVVGTLQYMSPEQAEMNALDIDTRTDVYALGVLLYELLTGSTPIDRATLDKAAIYKVLEAIREQDPPRPSVRLSSAGEAMTGISQQRRIEPRKLSQILQGDLDWIVMKALEKDRTRRYETANNFAEDVQRFIDGDAVEARPPSTAYRLQKFVRKNRSLVSSVGTIGVLLILATVVSALFADIASRASRKAKASEQAAIAAKVKADEAREKSLEVAERASKAEAAAEKAAAQAIASKEETEATLARSNFFLARSLWNENRAGEAVERLLDIPERYRNWEWYYSFREFEGSDMTLYGHEEGVSCVAFSPDGLRIASGSLDGSIKIWDSSTGKEILTLPAHGRAICFAFSPDGSQIVSGSTEKTIRLWDAATGENIATVLGHQDAVEDLAFSPDGTCLASGSRDGTIKLWNPRNLQELMTLDGHNDAVRSLSFSADSSRLVSLSSNSIKLWNAITGLPHFEIQKKGLHFSCAKFSPDGSCIAVDSPDGIALWNAKSGNELRTLVTSTGAVEYLAFSPEGSRIAGIVDSLVKVWDLATGDEIYSLRGHGIDSWNVSSVNMIAFSPDGSRIASAGTDATVKVWDVARGKNLTLECDPDLISVFHHEYTSDLARRVTVAENGEIALWDSVSGAKLNAIVTHEGPVDDVAISPNGKRIVSVSVADNSVKIWDAQLPKECIDLHGIKLSKNVPLHWIRFSEDSNLFATNMGDERVSIWNSRTGEECIRIKAGHIPLFCLSHDGTRLATVSLGTGVRVWDTATGKQCARANVVTDVTAVNDLAFNPDSSRIAILTSSDVRILDASTGECVLSLPEQLYCERVLFTPDGSSLKVDGISFDSRPRMKAFLLQTKDVVTDLTFSPDGSKILACAWDGTTGVWDTATNTQVLTLRGVTNEYTFAGFSPDGTRIAVFNGNLVKIYDSSTGIEIRTFAGHTLTGEVYFSIDGNRLFTQSQEKFVWDLESGTSKTVAEKPDDLMPRLLRHGSKFIYPRGSKVLLVDVASTDNEMRAFRLEKSRLDPEWHAEQANAAERLENWHAAVFHRVWQLKAQPNSFLASHRFRQDFDKWKKQFESVSHDSTTDPASLFQKIIPRIIREAVDRPPVTEFSESDGEFLDNLNGSIWGVVKARTEQPLVDFELFQLACQKHADRASLNTLGVAYYRLEKYADAVATLSKSLPLNMTGPDKTIGHPSDTAFLALSYLKLGDRPEAEKYRAMFDEAMKVELFSKDTDSLNFQKEIREAFDENK